MKRPLHLLRLLCLLALPAAASADRLMLNDFEGFDDMRFYGPGTQMPQTIRDILAMSREAGMDNWAWRDAVEDRLVTLGPNAVPYLQSALTTYDGFDADALQVALFRLDNPGLQPRDSLRDWGQKHFGIASAPPPSPADALKVTRIMDGPGGAGLRDLFPHHLFYALQYRRTRTVVALASDAKIQQLDEDAPLEKFFRTEAQPQPTVYDRSRLASAAALLTLARAVTPYKPEYRTQNLEGNARTFKYTLQFEGVRQSATLTFNAGGALDSLSTGSSKLEVKAAAPILAPTTIAAPPAMPE